MEVKGRIKFISPLISAGDSFKKIEVVVTTDEQYPQHIQIEFQGEKTSIINGYQLGQPVTVSINLRGREWTNPQGEVKYFNTITGWKISSDAPQQTQQQQPGYAPQQPQQGYGQPQQNYGAPQGYQQPANGYPANSAVNHYEQQQQGYGAPQQNYGQPAYR